MSTRAARCGRNRPSTLTTPETRAEQRSRTYSLTESPAGVTPSTCYLGDQLVLQARDGGERPAFLRQSTSGPCGSIAPDGIAEKGERLVRELRCGPALEVVRAGRKPESFARECSRYDRESCRHGFDDLDARSAPGPERHEQQRRARELGRHRGDIGGDFRTRPACRSDEGRGRALARKAKPGFRRARPNARPALGQETECSR